MAVRAWFRQLLLGFTITLGTACASETHTEIVVAVHSDLELSSVQFETFDVEGRKPVFDSKTVPIASDFAGKKGTRLPLFETVSKGRQPSFLLRVRGYQKPLDGGPEELVVQYKAKPTYETGKRLLLQVFLGHNCSGQLCSAEEACYALPGLGAPVGECGEIARFDALPEVSRGDELAPILSSGGADAGFATVKAEADASADDGAEPPDAGEGDGTGGEAGAGSECRLHRDCTASDASVCGEDLTCVGCSTDPDCAHIEGKQVCSEGQCVECTADDPSACFTSTGQPAVCDNRLHLCTEYAIGNTKGCGACISDAQCMKGQACVELMLPDSNPAAPEGFFCQWVFEPHYLSCDDTPAPFAKPLTDIGTIDYPAAQITVCAMYKATCADFERADTACGRYVISPSAPIVASWADEQIPPHLQETDLATRNIAPDSSVCGPRSGCRAKNAVEGRYVCALPCDRNDDCAARDLCGADKFCRPR